MRFQALPRIFYPNHELAAFLRTNGFNETTHESEAAIAMKHRFFKHKTTGLFISIEENRQQIVIENTNGWLYRYYPYISATALIYLITESPKKAADQALFHLLADIKP